MLVCIHCSPLGCFRAGLRNHRNHRAGLKDPWVGQLKAWVRILTASSSCTTLDQVANLSGVQCSMYRREVRIPKAQLTLEFSPIKR